MSGLGGSGQPRADEVNSVAAERGPLAMEAVSLS